MTKLNIGILHADDLSPALVQQFGDYSEMLQHLINCVSNEHKFQTYRVTQAHYPQDIDENDAYIITGSKASAYDDDEWIISLKDFIKQLFKQKKKLIGICFGHQIIAEALAGKVTKSDKGWGVGIKTSVILKKKTWMNPTQGKIALRYSHQDQVIKLPPDAELITSNEFCINCGYQISDHILTFQGHPEFNNNFLEYLMQGRKEIIGETNYQQAITSLQQNPDDKLIAKWLLQFIK